GRRGRTINHRHAASPGPRRPASAPGPRCPTCGLGRHCGRSGARNCYRCIATSTSEDGCTPLINRAIFVSRSGRRSEPSAKKVGFPRFEFPCFVGTMECSDFPPLFRPRFGVPSLGRTSAWGCVRSHGPDGGQGPGALGLAAPRQKLRKGNDGISQVPGESSCAYAMFFDPGRTDFARTYGGVGAAPVLTTTKAPTNLGTFEAQSHGLCTRCLRFALG